MEIVWFDCLPSTQSFLIEKIKNNELDPPICVAAHRQTDGIGSRGRIWEGADEALLFSFALPCSFLPKDLPIESSSIYFMYILKELLTKKGSSCWFKWPNDIYIEDDKIGGAITSLIKSKNSLICGIGLNLKSSDKYGECDIVLDKKTTLCDYFATLESAPSWKRIFIKFEVEFLNTRAKNPYRKSEHSYENAMLNGDGSLSIDNKKVFSLR